MFFCPNCNNSLSITEQGQVSAQISTENMSETPITVSSSSQEPIKEEPKNVAKIILVITRYILFRLIGILPV